MIKLTGFVYRITIYPQKLQKRTKNSWKEFHKRSDPVKNRVASFKLTEYYSKIKYNSTPIGLAE